MDFELILDVKYFKFHSSIYDLTPSRKIIFYLEACYKNRVIRSKEIRLQPGAKLAVPWSTRLQSFSIEFYYIDSQIRYFIGRSEMKMPTFGPRKESSKIDEESNLREEITEILDTSDRKEKNNANAKETKKDEQHVTDNLSVICPGSGPHHICLDILPSPGSFRVGRLIFLLYVVSPYCNEDQLLYNKVVINVNREKKRYVKDYENEKDLKRDANYNIYNKRNLFFDEINGRYNGDDDYNEKNQTLKSRQVHFTESFSTEKKIKNTNEQDNFYENIPGFKFKRLSKVINYDRLKHINVDKIIETTDTRTLMSLIDDIALGDAADEDVDVRLLRILQLSQFSVQYLLSSRRSLESRRRVLREVLDTFSEEEEILDLKIAKLRARKKAMRRELDETDQVTESYQRALKLLKIKNISFKSKSEKEKKKRATSKNEVIEELNNTTQDFDLNFIEKNLENKEFKGNISPRKPKNRVQRFSDSDSSNSEDGKDPKKILQKDVQLLYVSNEKKNLGNQIQQLSAKNSQVISYDSSSSDNYSDFDKTMEKSESSVEKIEGKNEYSISIPKSKTEQKSPSQDDSMNLPKFLQNINAKEKEMESNMFQSRTSFSATQSTFGMSLDSLNQDNKSLNFNTITSIDSLNKNDIDESNMDESDLVNMETLDSEDFKYHKKRFSKNSLSDSSSSIESIKNVSNRLQEDLASEFEKTGELTTKSSLKLSNTYPSNKRVSFSLQEESKNNSEINLDSPSNLSQSNFSTMDSLAISESASNNFFVSGDDHESIDLLSKVELDKSIESEQDKIVNNDSNKLESDLGITSILQEDSIGNQQSDISSSFVVHFKDFVDNSNTSLTNKIEDNNNNNAYDPFDSRSIDDDLDNNQIFSTKLSLNIPEDKTLKNENDFDSMFSPNFGSPTPNIGTLNNLELDNLDLSNDNHMVDIVNSDSIDNSFKNSKELLSPPILALKTSLTSPEYKDNLKSDKEKYTKNLMFTNSIEKYSLAETLGGETVDSLAQTNETVYTDDFTQEEDDKSQLKFTDTITVNSYDLEGSQDIGVSQNSIKTTSTSSYQNEKLKWIEGRASLESIELAKSLQVGITGLRLDENLSISNGEYISISFEFLECVSPASSPQSWLIDGALHPLTHFSYMEFNEEALVTLVDEIQNLGEGLHCYVNIYDCGNESSTEVKHLGYGIIELWSMIERNASITREEIPIYTPDMSNIIGCVVVDVKGHQLLTKYSTI